MKPVVHCYSNEEQRPQLAPGMLVYYQEDPVKWLSSAEGDPMLMLEADLNELFAEAKELQ